ncbi:MAG TPA: aldose 1-epimerase [Anaerolineae bacterium]
MLTIENEILRVRVLPDPGASIVSFEGKRADSWLPLMRPTPPEVLAAPKSGMLASFNLVPWSNRVVDARFEFERTYYKLRPNTPQGFAIHGDVRERAWRVVESTPTAITCTLDSNEFSDFNFPFPLHTSIRYQLKANTYTTTLAVENAGDQPMPVGFGFHPYFNRGIVNADDDEAQLELRVQGVYPPLPGMSASPVPQSRRTLAGDDATGMIDVPPSMDFSTRVQVGKRDIDHCFGGWDGRAEISYPRSGVKLEFECDAVFGHVIVFTPPGKPFFAVEPVTHANDGFNLYARAVCGNGIRVLQPHESISGAFHISVSL